MQRYEEKRDVRSQFREETKNTEHPASLSLSTPGATRLNLGGKWILYSPGMAGER